MVPFGFSPYNHYYIPILSLAILFHLVATATPRQALLYGYLFGFAMFGVGVNWLHISINLFGGVSLFGALCYTYALVGFISLYPALSCYLARRLFTANRTGFLLFGIPACWVIMEWCRSWVLTGFPWLNLGYSQIDSPIGAVAPILGVYGVSYCVVLLASLVLLTCYLTLRLKIATLFSLILFWLFADQLYLYDWTEPAQSNVNVALIQGGIKQEDKWKPEMRQPSLELYQSLSDNYWDHQLIIWPETAIPAFYHDVDEVVQALKDKASHHNTNIIVGVPYQYEGSSDYFNSAVLVNQDSEVYNKRHLVPFGEYLPFDSLVRPLLHWLKIPMSSFSRGNQERPLIVAKNMTIGISICYEDTFGEEVIEALPDAGVLVNLSNDAWFGDSLAPHQHLQMARMRAMETGRYMLRATNTGISAVIDEKGRIVKQSRQFEADSLAAEISLFKGSTPYVRFGNDAILLFCILVMTIAFILTKISYRRTSFG